LWVKPEQPSPTNRIKRHTHPQRFK
jgi:hypothetical protein